MAMVTTEQQTPGGASVAQRWLARLALVAAAAAVLVAPLVAGFGKGLALVLVGLAGLALSCGRGVVGPDPQGPGPLAGGRGGGRGPARRAGPVHQQGAAVGRAGGVGAAGGGRRRRPGRAARRPRPREDARTRRPAAQAAVPDHEPALWRREGDQVRSQGQGRGPGRQVALLEGPGTVDVGELARTAVADGADLLGVAGGDGTQALVAGIAAEHDVPLLVISAGTRNHFALDLGLDREDPSRCLDALARRGRAPDRPGGHRRPPVRQQRLLRGLCRHRAEPGLPRRQAPHDDRDAARSAGRPAAGRGWWPGPRT